MLRIVTLAALLTRRQVSLAQLLMNNTGTSPVFLRSSHFCPPF
jgi:hypothetical protein